MAKQRRIIVRGKQRTNIDAMQLAQALVAIAADWQKPEPADSSPDAFDAAVVDRQAEGTERAG
jgi:hypothetical protein